MLKCNHKNFENQKIPDVKIMTREIFPEGTIKITTQGTKYIKENGRWVYVKKPKKPKKIKERSRVEYNYPPVRIPKGMRETEFSGYYISDDGKAYREPGKYDRNEQYGKINEYGLIYLKPALRGHPGRPEYQYECINISIRDENGKFLKQIKKSIHQLVAEAFVPNLEGHREILHMDENNRNNHYTNLKWGTHKENMKMIGLPEGTVKEHKRYGNSQNPTKYIKKDGEWVLIPTDKPVWNKGLKGSSWNTLPDGTVTTRKVNGKPGTFIKQNGKWIYQKKRKSKSKKDSQPRQSLPEGSIRTRADGTTWKKQNGKWIYQKKKKY